MGPTGRNTGRPFRGRRQGPGTSAGYGDSLKGLDHMDILQAYRREPQGVLGSGVPWYLCSRPGSS